MSVLLIWDRCGEGEPELYELEGAQAELAQLCNGKLANESGLTKDDEINLDKLSEQLMRSEKLNFSKGTFGPYDAIYISGFIP